ncbi:MAG: hypothetical protein AB7V45_08690 [Candidatus Krumholzibacteriia bacterium]
MRRLMTRFALILLAGFLGGCASSSHPLVGSWRLVEFDGRPVEEEMVKIVTPTRFAFGREDGGGVWAGGGRVEVTRGVYTEIIEYHSKARLVGMVADFTFALKDGRWIHQGIIAAPGGKVEVDEVWERIED